MKEKELKNLVKEHLEDEGWISWWPPKVRWYANNDIFGIFDCIAIKGGKIKLIQITTHPNRAARRRKIQHFLSVERAAVLRCAWLWVWHTKKKELIKEPVTFLSNPTYERRHADTP